MSQASDEGIKVKEGKIRVLFELDENWIDFESPMGIVGWTLREELHRTLKEALIEQLISKTELPAITISKEELKKAVIDRMADKLVQEKLRGGE